MPFTLSHPAAVLPFHRWCPRRLDLPALIVGSMLPDVGYFFYLMHFSAFLHKPLGSLLTIPLGLVALACWRFIQSPIAELLPNPHQEFLKSFEVRKFSVKELLILSVSIFIGAWTHILWDSFTHAHGLFVDLFPQFFKYSFTAGGAHVPVFKCLQYGFSVVGLLYLSSAYRRSLAAFEASMSTPVQERDIGRKVAVLVCIPCLSFLLAFTLASYQQIQVGFGTDRLVFLFIVYTLAFSLALLVITAFVIRRLKER